MSLLTYYDTYIKPVNDQLGRLLAEVKCDTCGYMSHGNDNTCPICDKPLTEEEAEQ